ncbi:MAG: alpha/beta hydrolase [Conexibacter sp.]|nr:alpha/beta hydrolase [Conexibacter sp.]
MSAPDRTPATGPTHPTPKAMHPMTSSHASARRPLHALLGAAIAAIAALALAAPQPAAAAGTAAKPTIVLVHGAWADGSSWAGEVGRLQRAGYTVDVPANPLRGLASDTAYLASYLKSVSGPIVLAGHSYGGAVITGAATGDAAVKALVYVDAYIPDQGESILQLTGAKPGSAFADPAKAFNLIPYAGGPAGDVDLYIKPSVFHQDFAADLSARQAATLAATQRPLAASVLQAPAGPPAWKTIRAFSIFGSQDRVLPPAEQVAMARRAHAPITRVKGSHLALVSKPDAVTSVIERAAGAVR